jgi:hypothetical protein
MSDAVAVAEAMVVEAVVQIAAKQELGAAEMAQMSAEQVMMSAV